MNLIRHFCVRGQMPRDLLAGTQDHHLVDEALYQDISKAEGCRHGVVVAAVSDQRGRRDPVLSASRTARAVSPVAA